MPLLSTAAGCATIVSLIGMFRTERRAADAQSKETYEEFIEWLRRREHTQVASMLEGNTSLAKHTQHVIAANHSDVMEQLETINAVVADIASNLTGFAGLAAACAIESGLSKQAVSILKQMNEANASQFLECPLMSVTKWELWDGDRGQIETFEPRFLEDDLSKLCLYDLLIMEYNDSGNRMYTITRAGAAVGQHSDT